MKIHEVSTGDKVYRYERSIVMFFDGKRKVLSTSVYHGGYHEDLTAVFNHDGKRGAGTVSYTHLDVYKRQTGMFLAVLTINCIIFSALGFVAAMLIDSHEDMGSFNTYVLLPMSFLCGTFFATDKLPEVIHYFLMLLPLTHTSSALRSLAMQGQVSEISLLVLFLYMIVLLGIGIWTMYRIRK